MMLLCFLFVYHPADRSPCRPVATGAVICTRLDQRATGAKVDAVGSAWHPGQFDGRLSSDLGGLAPVIRTHLLDAPQLQADPALAFRKVGRAPAVLAARPERHAV